MTTASIVIHNTSPYQLSKVLDCLLRSDVKFIYIIDNGEINTFAELNNKDERIIYLKTINRGYGAGHNIAIKKSMENKADYHLVLNADVWWDGNVIGNIENYMNDHKDVGLVSPKIFYPDGDLQYSCRKLPNPIDLFAKRFLPHRFIKSKLNNYLLSHHDHDFALNCPYLLGSFLFFRIVALKETGLFDERFFMYPEDIDITRRIHKNWKTIYWPEVKIVHEHQAASRKNFRMLKIHIENMIKYFNKWGWWKDKEREELNKMLEKSLVKLDPNKHQKGRG